MAYRRFTEQSMWLPDGKTCSDCRLFERCQKFLGEKNCPPDGTACDWSPSHFRPIDAALRSKGGGCS